MTRLGWFECLVIVAFFFSAMAAFLTGGMVWAGYVFVAFLVTVFGWAVRQLYLEVKDTIMEEIRKAKQKYDRIQALSEWGNRRKQLKGME